VLGGERGEFAGAGGAYSDRAAAARQDFEHRSMGYPRTQGSFQGWMNAGQQPSDSVADASGFAGEIIVETDQHSELGEVSSPVSTRRNVCGMVRAVSAMMNASRASVFAFPGYRSAIRRIDKPGRYAT
jgi:hypothetical protein